jgi:hypothetical protein
MLAYEWKGCTIMVKGSFVLIKGPIFWMMTRCAVDVEVRTMRGLGQDALTKNINQKEK